MRQKHRQKQRAPQLRPRPSLNPVPRRPPCHPVPPCPVPPSSIAGPGDRFGPRSATQPTGLLAALLDPCRPQKEPASELDPPPPPPPRPRSRPPEAVAAAERGAECGGAEAGRRPSAVAAAVGALRGGDGGGSGGGGCGGSGEGRVEARLVWQEAAVTTEAGTGKRVGSCASISPDPAEPAAATTTAESCWGGARKLEQAMDEDSPASARPQEELRLPLPSQPPPAAAPSAADSARRDFWNFFGCGMGDVGVEARLARLEAAACRGGGARVLLAQQAAGCGSGVEARLARLEAAAKQQQRTLDAILAALSAQQ
jgi:hypothetical protein